MLGSAALEVGIGLVFVYVLLGLACAAVNEQISQYLGLRANHLWESICALLADREGTGIAADLYDHQLVRGLAVAQGSPGDGSAEHPADRPMPSCIPADVFASALDDLWKGRGGASKRAKEGPLAQLKSALDPLYAAAGGSREAALLKIGAWYDDAMERAVGWYKRKVQLTLFLVAAIIVTASNSDSIMIANELWHQPAVRTALSDRARSASQAELSQLKGELTAQESMLLGWSQCREGQQCTASERLHAVPSGLSGWILKVLGLLVTAYAATLGAPFWFDLMRKIVGLRANLTALRQASVLPSAGQTAPEKDTGTGGKASES